MMGLASLAVLEGTWSIVREILHDDGARDQFEGETTFVRAGPRLVQDEVGWLTPGTGGQALRATRRYVWSQIGSQVDVMFADMRPFHCFSVGVETPTATHLCPPDRYEVAYDFSQMPAWRSVWRVDGPRKAYRMTSEFKRVAT